MDFSAYSMYKQPVFIDIYTHLTLRLSVIKETIKNANEIIKFVGKNLFILFFDNPAQTSQPQPQHLKMAANMKHQMM